jgi:hypothetical protein
MPIFPSLAMICLLLKCPESPKFLYLSCGERENAQAVLNELCDGKQANSMFVSLIKENSETQVGVHLKNSHLYI